MNIFNKVALQGLEKNRTRTIVTIIGVILSAAMITAVVTFGVSLLDYLIKGAAQKYGNWHIAFLNADSSFVKERMLDKEVTNTVTFENIGYAKLNGGKNPNKPYLFIAGFNQESFDALPLTLLSGRFPENSTEILISGKIETDGGVSYTLGDTLSLLVGNRINGNERLSQDVPYTLNTETLTSEHEKTYTVVGICQSPVFEENSSPGYTIITKIDKITAEDNLSLFVTLKNPYQVPSYADTMAISHAYILNNKVLRFMGISNSPSDKLFNALLYSLGSIVIIIIMIGSIFLIYNSFSISLNERTRQIGILSSVGATAKQLRNSVLFEGLCIGMIGIPIGVLIGLSGIGFLISIVSNNFKSILYTGIPLTLTISTLAIIGAIIVSIITILISAYIPAKKATNMPVMECIRQTNEVKLEVKAVKTSKQAHNIYGLEGILALKNFRRNKKRYRSIILSLILSIVLFISTSALVMDLQQIADPTVEVSNCDISFGTQAMESNEMLKLYDQLRAVNGVYDSSYQIYMEYSGSVHTSELSNDYWEIIEGNSLEETTNLTLGIRFFDDNTYLKIIESLNLPVEEYMGQNAKQIAVAQIQDNSNHKEGDPINDMFTNSSINLTIAPKTENEFKTKQEQNISITFAEFVPLDIPPTTENLEHGPYTFWIIFPWSQKDLFFSADTADIRMLKGMAFQSKNPSQSIAEMKTVIQNARISSAYLLLNMSEMLEENQNYIFIANIFAYTFIIIISLIAIANVFNTISTNIKLRKRELAMLRSIGMSDRDFNKMMRFECIFYGMRALFFGLPIAIIVSWFIHKKMATNDINFVLPWASIVISIFSVLLIIFITMMYAIRKIKKENIIDALRDDMT